MVDTNNIRTCQIDRQSTDETYSKETEGIVSLGSEKAAQYKVKLNELREWVALACQHMCILNEQEVSTQQHQTAERQPSRRWAMGEGTKRPVVFAVEFD